MKPGDAPAEIEFWVLWIDGDPQRQCLNGSLVVFQTTRHNTEGQIRYRRTRVELDCFLEDAFALLKLTRVVKFFSLLHEGFNGGLFFAAFLSRTVSHLPAVKWFLLRALWARSRGFGKRDVGGRCHAARLPAVCRLAGSCCLGKWNGQLHDAFFRRLSRRCIRTGRRGLR